MLPRKPLRVCHVAYSFYESDNRVMRYAETLAARGDRVDVIALRQPRQASRGSLNGVNVYRVQRRVLNEKASWHYLLKIAWFFLKCFLLLGVRSLSKAYDIVHVHNIPDFLVFTAAIPKLLGTRVILDIHDIVPELYAGKFGASQNSRLFRSLLLVERMSCRFADHVFVANHLWHDRLIGRSVPPGKCSPFLNYPDLALFRPLPRERTEGGDGFLFLYPGTLNIHQGLDIAIAAFAEACPRMIGAKFHIYGDGPARDALREQARTLGLGDRVKIMERVPLRDVPELMASADVGVEPKSGRGFGNEALSTKILEFMACGVPVVVSKTMAHAHYFAADLVVFFSPDDVADLAGSMVRLYNGQGRNSASIESARAFAVAHSWQRHSGEYVGLVDSLTTVCLPAPTR